MRRQTLQHCINTAHSEQPLTCHNRGQHPQQVQRSVSMSEMPVWLCKCHWTDVIMPKEHIYVASAFTVDSGHLCQQCQSTTYRLQ